MNSFDLLFEGAYLIAMAVFNLFFGVVYIWEAIKAPNKYISLGALDYFAIQLPIYAAIAAYFAQIFGMPIPHFIHLIIGFSFIPFTLIIWLYLFTRIYPKRNIIMR